VKGGEGWLLHVNDQHNKRAHNNLLSERGRACRLFVDKSDLTNTIFFVSANRRPLAGTIADKKPLLHSPFEEK
jgi:hypothetical protein